jgi:hypothetical protein
VLKALENEPEDRYPDALEFAAALRDGLDGIAPSAAATTRMMRDETAATRIAREPKTPAAPVPAPRPRRRPTPAAVRPAPVATQPASRSRSTFSKLMRVIGGIILIALVAAIVAAVILLATDAGSNTDVAQYIRDNVNDQVDAIQQFIDEHTGGN